MLAYRVGIPLDKRDEYIHSTPSESEINRIYFAIQDDRKGKTLRIKEALSKVVDYREAKEFSNKIRVSDTVIREIIEGKKQMAGYDVINRLELFLSVIMPDFEIYLENPPDVRSYTQEQIGEILSNVDKVADNLKYYCYKLTNLAGKMEKDKDWQGNDIEPTYFLDKNIEHLSELKIQIDLFWRVYIDKKN